MKADFQDRYFALNPPSAAQPAGAVPTSQSAPADIPTVDSPEAFQALAPGATFMSGGKRYTKPAAQVQQFNDGRTVSSPGIHTKDVDVTYPTGPAWNPQYPGVTSGQPDEQ